MALCSLQLTVYKCPNLEAASLKNMKSWIFESNLISGRGGDVCLKKRFVETFRKVDNQIWKEFLDLDEIENKYI